MRVCFPSRTKYRDSGGQPEMDGKLGKRSKFITSECVFSKTHIYLHLPMRAFRHWYNYVYHLCKSKNNNSRFISKCEKERFRLCPRRPRGTKLEQDSSDTRMNRYGRKGENRRRRYPIIWSAAQTREASQRYRRHLCQRWTNSSYGSFVPSFLPVWTEGMLISAGDSEKHTHTHAHTELQLCAVEVVALNWSSDMEKVGLFLAPSCSLCEPSVFLPRAAEFQQHNCSSEAQEKKLVQQSRCSQRDPPYKSTLH